VLIIGSHLGNAGRDGTKEAHCATVRHLVQKANPSNAETLGGFLTGNLR
jgi:hypothetical protein